MKFRSIAIATAVLGSTTGLAHAQTTGEQRAPQSTAPSTSAATDPIDIKLRGGLSAERLLDTQARGADGKKLDEVENFLGDTVGKITGVIIESQGFFEVGDTHLFVPWKQVEVGPNLDYVQVPVNESTLPNFSLFNNDEYIAKGAGVLRGSQLMNDWVRLRQGAVYCYGDDVIFTADGQIQAIVVSPDMRYGYGLYAYPYSYGTYRSGLGYYGLPYARSDIAKLKPFDYSALDIANDSTVAQRR